MSDGRGYFGIGIVAGKTPDNVGGLWRSAHAFGANFIFTVGARYPKRAQATDTTEAWKHVPFFEYDSIWDFSDAIPRGCSVVGIECDDSLITRSLVSFDHPERVIYVLGAEDRGIPMEMLQLCDALIEIPTTYCLNVATAGTVVLYDRVQKTSRPGTITV